MADCRRLLSARNDEAHWQASSSGDDRAFATLYERRARKIYNYLFRRLADWSEAEDLTAVVFLEAFRRRRDAVVVDGKLFADLEDAGRHEQVAVERETLAQR